MVRWPNLLAVLAGLGVPLAACEPAGRGTASAPRLTAAPLVVCNAQIIVLDAASVGPTGKYEVLGAVDLSKPIANDPLSLEQRIRHRACAMKADAVGVMTTSTGSGGEYIAVRIRPPRMGPATSTSKVEYFPMPHTSDGASNVIGNSAAMPAP